MPTLTPYCPARSGRQCPDESAPRLSDSSRWPRPAIGARRAARGSAPCARGIGVRVRENMPKRCSATCAPPGRSLLPFLVDLVLLLYLCVRIRLYGSASRFDQV